MDENGEKDGKPQYQASYMNLGAGRSAHHGTHAAYSTHTHHHGHHLPHIPALPGQVAPIVPSAVELEPIAGVPAGLESFYTVNSLYISEQLDFAEAVLDFEMNNHYFVFNPMGHRVFFAGENTRCCDRYLCGNRRPFKLNIFDCFGRPVIEVERPCGFCLWYCRPGVYGSNANVILKTTNEIIGRIEQNWSCTTPAFSVYDYSGALALRIRGPCCAGCSDCLLCCDAEFTIYDALTDQVVGSILKQFTLKETVSDANNFGFSVRGDMDVRLKAVLLAAVFLIDFTYFEDSAGKNDRGSNGGPGVQRTKRYPCQNCCHGCSGICLTVILVIILAIIITIVVLVYKYK